MFDKASLYLDAGCKVDHDEVEVMNQFFHKWTKRNPLFVYEPISAFLRISKKELRQLFLKVKKNHPEEFA